MEFNNIFFGAMAQASIPLISKVEPIKSSQTLNRYLIVGSIVYNGKPMTGPFTLGFVSTLEEASVVMKTWNKDCAGLLACLDIQNNGRIVYFD